jgi:hypothetical protein
MIQFDFGEWSESVVLPDDAEFGVIVDEVKQRLQVMNLHLLCLNTVLMRDERYCVVVPRLTTEDVLQFSDHGYGGPGTMSVPIGYLSSGEAIRHRAISVAVLDASFEMLDDILSRTDDATRAVLDLVHLALDAVVIHDYALCLTSAWTACESLLNMCWRDYIESRRTDENGAVVVNARRRERLVGGNDYTASIKTEVLTLAGVVPHAFYDDLSRVRRSRNAWLHNTTPPTSDDAAVALRTARDLISMKLGIALQFPIGNLEISPPNFT